MITTDERHHCAADGDLRQGGRGRHGCYGHRGRHGPTWTPQSPQTPQRPQKPQTRGVVLSPPPPWQRPSGPDDAPGAAARPGTRAPRRARASQRSAAGATAPANAAAAPRAARGRRGSACRAPRRSRQRRRRPTRRCTSNMGCAGAALTRIPELGAGCGLFTVERVPDKHRIPGPRIRLRRITTDAGGTDHISCL